MKYFEVCYGKDNSICIRGEVQPSKEEAENFLFSDAARLGYNTKKGVTKIIELSKEEAYSAFDMENEERFPVFKAI